MTKVLTIKGVGALTKQFTRIKNKSEIGLQKGLFVGGLLLQRESQKIVPIATSTLKKSADTWKVPGLRNGTDVMVGYGTDYAIYVHEDLEARHAAGKQAKFLEQPLRDFQTQIAEVIAKTIRGLGV